jgi:hypothetical protein
VQPPQLVIHRSSPRARTSVGPFGLGVRGRSIAEAW